MQQLQVWKGFNLDEATACLGSSGQELAKIGQEALDFKAKAEKLAAELQV